jgi:hypothetical protein
MWGTLAAAQGDKTAAAFLDAVAPYLTPAQIAEAHRMARDWRPVVADDFDPDAYLAEARDHTTERHARPVGSSAVPTFDDLPDNGAESWPGAAPLLSTPKGQYEGLDWDQVFPRADQYGVGPAWRFKVLGWMRLAEGVFASSGLAVIGALLLFWLAGARLKKSRVSILLGRISALLSSVRTDSKRYRLMVTLSAMFVIGWLSLRETLDPTSFDRQQLLVNLEAHPLDNILGGLIPVIVLAPLGYWLYGWALRRKMGLQLSRRIHDLKGRTADLVRHAITKTKELTTAKAYGAAAIVVGGLLFMSRYEFIPYVPLAHAESVYVKYRGDVDLRPFRCSDISRSSFVNRVCYDQRNQYMLISLNGTFYHYCELSPTTFDAFMAAPSMGQFYNQNIKGWGNDGPYDCRTHKVPQY